uniref:Uncharacterized protein n=1 Tax=Cucumis sativus TaxID=3659 RepID=A0A0A0KTG5_CUCSA
MSAQPNSADVNHLLSATTTSTSASSLNRHHHSPPKLTAVAAVSNHFSVRGSPYMVSSTTGFTTALVQCTTAS